jgi:outer membrane receptor for ferrienterochelin and colicins
MRRHQLILCLVLFVLSREGYSQKLLGVVFHKNEKGVDEPLPGANVHWLNTAMAAATKENGVFLIERSSQSNTLVISYVGFASDTVKVNETDNNIRVELTPLQSLNEVLVEGWQPSSKLSYASGINLVEIGEKELFKAACCNLSESFETNPSVDVAFTDAVTGTRQIQMLGLAGPNTMISIENMPGVRGLASNQGIQFIPGTWIQSIQLTKGVGSVINGYESIAGQLNVELKKPQESDKVYLNGYVNTSGRTEANLIYTTQPAKKWGTTFLLHSSARPFEMDQNQDGFLDFPTGTQVNFVNRWVFNSGTGWLAQFSIKYLNDNKQGGQTNFNPSDKFTTQRYGLEIKSDRFEFVGKLGYQFTGKPYKSIGFQYNALTHNHKSYVGFNEYNALENSIYGNLIYQSIIRSTANKFKTGISFLYDQYDETLVKKFDPKIELPDQTQSFLRNELVPGAFVEYTYDDMKRFSLIAGARVDFHNLYGAFFTPRLHLRYNPIETTTLRASAGSGTRVGNVILENTGFLASSRELVFENKQSDKAYGFKPEKAWNYGINVAQEFTLDYRTGVITIDYFYTDFRNQVVVDYDKSPQQIIFSGLTGKSFSHSLQAQLDYQLARRFDVRIAYRWLDVETDYSTGRLLKPLVPRGRAFINLAYSTKTNWKFDYTVQRIGEQRLPSTRTNPVEYQRPSTTPAYILMSAQVTKDIGTKWSAYVGMENLTNFTTKDPIISAANPFNAYFDTTLVWGPIFGAMLYGGFRYRVK